MQLIARIILLLFVVWAIGPEALLIGAAIYILIALAGG